MSTNYFLNLFLLGNGFYQQFRLFKFLVNVFSIDILCSIIETIRGKSETTTFLIKCRILMVKGKLILQNTYFFLKKEI